MPAEPRGSGIVTLGGKSELISQDAQSPPSYLREMFDKSQLSPEDREFLEKAAGRARQQRMEYAMAMLPAMGVLVVVGILPTLLLLLLGLFSLRITVASFALGMFGSALLFRKLQR